MRHGAVLRLLWDHSVIAAMMLLLEVLAIATLGDWILALLSSTVASLAFSYYFIEEAGNFRLSTLEGFVTFGAMALTALTGSRLSVLAQRRAQEAIRRREEMERLNQLGRVLLGRTAWRKRRRTRCGKWSSCSTFRARCCGCRARRTRSNRECPPPERFP